MTTATVTVQAGAEVLGECLRCGGEMTVAPHVMGIELGEGAYLCDPCFLYVFNGSRARAAEALGLGPSGGGDGDDGPDGGPAAPALAPVELAVSAARSARPFTHLSELPPAERAEYEAWAAEVVAEMPDPEPCIQCGRPASPYEETPTGPLCFRCWGPAPSPGLAGPRPAPVPAVLVACECECECECEETAAMSQPFCRRCDLLQSETWRLSQRQMELERRLADLARAVDRLAHLVQATRRELATLARRAS